MLYIPETRRRLLAVIGTGLIVLSVVISFSTITAPPESVLQRRYKTPGGTLTPPPKIGYETKPGWAKIGEGAAVAAGLLGLAAFGLIWHSILKDKEGEDE